MLYSSTNRNRMTIVVAYIHIRGVIAILPMAEGGLAKVPLMFFFAGNPLYICFLKSYAIKIISARRNSLGIGFALLKLF